jgi:hypothetical protein
LERLTEDAFDEHEVAHGDADHCRWVTQQRAHCCLN